MPKLKQPLWGLLLLLLSGGCAYTLKVQDGDTAMDRKQYAQAVVFYKKDLDKARSRVQQGRIALKLADAHTRLNQPAQALPYYQMAWSAQAGVSALRGKAYSLKMLERYDEAMDAFRQLGEEIGSSYEYRREIQACETARRWQREEKQNPFQVTPLPINSRYSDFAPYPDGEGRLYFTSDRARGKEKEIYPWTGRPYSRIYTGDPETGIVSDQLPGALATINSPFNDGTLQLDQRGMAYFTRCGEGQGYEDRYCRIYQVHTAGGEPAEPERLPFCTGPFNYGHPSPSSDGLTLFFASDDPSGMGGYDLYMTIRTATGWLDPVMLPPSINTPGDEMFPWLEGDTLYFASDYHPGMGGLDLFRARRTGLRSWSGPENLKPPINSGADDFGLVWLPDASGAPQALRRGVFSSTRPGGMGDDDLYLIREVPAPAIVEAPPADTIARYLFELDIFVLRRIYATPGDPNSALLGRRPLSGAGLRISGDMDTLLTTQGEGPVRLSISPGQWLSLEATAPGFLNARAAFDARDLAIDPQQPVQRYELEIVLDERWVEKEIVLENIYYDFDRWEIRADAEPTLRQLAAMLKANPDILIELASHTDCRGGATYNQDLSQRRAESAVQFLIAQGVEERRLRARGYGESRPANDCICTRCTEAEHQQNRRTTFRILEN